MTPQENQEMLADSTNPGWSHATFTAHSLLGLRGDSRLMQSAVSQSGVIYDAYVRNPGLETFFDDYSKAVGDFWSNALSRSAFEFSSPREVGRVLTDAPVSPPLRRAKVILREAINSLSAPISEETRRWLNSET